MNRLRPTAACALAVLALPLAAGSALVASAPDAAAVPAARVVAAPAAPTTPAAPNTDDCPFRHSPPPPVDASEAPRPGRAAPTPLPVPATAVGGTGLAGCGLLAPPGAAPPPEDVSAAGWVLADLDSGDVLAAKDPHGRHRPASTIKILLAAVALRDLDLDTVLTATDAEANVEGSRVGVGPGGRYTVHTLLRGLMMNSGNDAAQVLADAMGGTAATTSAMNTLAQHLGALDTRTPTPSGLDGPGMSTSAYDLALMFRDAMSDPVFADLISHGPIEFPGYPRTEAQRESALADAAGRLAAGAEPITVDPSAPADSDPVAAALADARPDPATGLLPPVVAPDGSPLVADDNPGFLIANDNPLLTGYPGALGGKTGYTDDAGQTFIGAAERDGRRLVVTLMDGTREPVAPWRQAASLLDYGFALPPAARVGTLVDPGSVRPEGDDVDGAGSSDGTGGTGGALAAGASDDSGVPAGGSGHGAGYYGAVGVAAAAALLLAGTGVRILRRRR